MAAAAPDNTVAETTWDRSTGNVQSLTGPGYTVTGRDAALNTLSSGIGVSVRTTGTMTITSGNTDMYTATRGARPGDYFAGVNPRFGLTLENTTSQLPCEFLGDPATHPAGSSYECLEPNTRLTVTFTEPVTNPVLSLAGLGGWQTSGTFRAESSVRLTLTSPSSASLMALTSNGALAITGSPARTIAVPGPRMDRTCHATESGLAGNAGCGTVVVRGTGTTFSFDVAMTGTIVRTDPNCLTDSSLWCITWTDAFAMQVGLVGPQAPDATGAPTVAPVPGGLRVTVPPPAYDGGSPVTYYEYSIDGGVTWRSTGTPSPEFVIEGLVPGTEYRVSVRAVNAAGTGPASEAGAGRAGVTSSPTISLRPPSLGPDGSVRATATPSTAGTIVLTTSWRGRVRCRSTRVVTRAGATRMRCALPPSMRAVAKKQRIRLVVRAQLTDSAGRTAAATRVLRTNPRPARIAVTG
jgi:hypothetical protein